MNVNVKISLTDEERNTLYRRITGKDVKRMISRKEVCELVQQHIDDLLEGIEQVVETVAEPQIELGLSIHDRPETHDECCRVNAALRSRLNRLQHALDTKRYTTV